MNPTSIQSLYRLLVVDDDHQGLDSLVLLLRAYGYEVVAAENASIAIELLQKQAIDIVLTDIRMPGIDGLELAGRVHELYPDMPVLIMTAFAEMDVAIGAIKRGAFDFIFKPINPDYLIHSIRKASAICEMNELKKQYHEALQKEVAQKTQDLMSLNSEIIHRLTIVAEYRDSDTGSHNARIGYFAGIIAGVLGLPVDFAETIILASSLHDIGKVGIPDSILLKPEGLTEEEFMIIKTHTTLGAKMLAGSTHTVIKMGESIALTHHERWDGTGYPRGLAGEAIAIEGRIVLLADQYDALRSKRPYKPAFDHEKTLKIITEGDGRSLPKHIDPLVLKAFIAAAPAISKVYDAHALPEG